MISDPNLVRYACVAKETTILAEYTSEDRNHSTLASKCLEQTPPFHSMFSHTIRKQSYTFLIDFPCVYFAISDEDLDKSEAFWFLNQLKETFCARNLVGRLENVSSHCLQGEFDSIFRELLSEKLKEFDEVNAMDNMLTNSRNVSLDSSRGKKMVSAPLLGKPSKGLKKKKRLSGEIYNGEGKDDIGNDNKDDVCDDGVSLSRDISVSLHKNGMYVLGDGGRQKAKQLQTWRRHLWVVLLIDLFVCVLLFGIWLWICRGFKCIDG